MKALRAFIKSLLPWLAFAALVAATYVYRGSFLRLWFALPMPSSVDQGLTASDLKSGDVAVIARDLNVPWAIAFLPGGDLLVTERSGTLRRIGRDGGASLKVADTSEIGEGGLLGVAVHPKFVETRWIYLYLTSETDDGIRNRIERYRLEDDRLDGRTTILQNIPAAPRHDGGALAFGPDGMLYATTGDADDQFSAQDRNSLAGKILRLRDDGSIPKDNPFGNAVWSYGHRNGQGLAWDDRGRLWATEHGRSGLRSGLDELNLIEPGKNYGWPVIQGGQSRDGMERPVAHSGSWETWAPSGIAHLNGSLYFGGLRGEALFQGAPLEGDLKLRAHFQKEYGRIRAVAVGPDRMIYVATSNRDGRGDPREGDDKILRFHEVLFVR